MAQKDSRFVKVLEDSGFISSSEVLVDTQTGVQYLYHAVGNSGGLTLLVDADGKPLVPQDAGRTGILNRRDRYDHYHHPHRRGSPHHGV